MMGELPFSLLTFECIAHLSDGHAVHVVGDHPALGCWDVAKSVPLSSAPAQGPVSLSQSPVSVPSGVPLQYKYVICDHGQLVRWESFDGNRFVTPMEPEGTVRDELDRFSDAGVAEGLAQESHAAASEAAVAEAAAATAAAAAGSAASLLRVSSRAASIIEDQPTQDSTVLVVSYILPLIISKATDGSESWAIEWNQDAVTAKKQQNLTERKRVLWIGCPGIHVDEEDEPGLTAALQEFGCVPVFLDAELEHTFYFGFCRSFLWPTFHNVIKSRCFAQKVWRAYCTANRKFADKVIEVYDSGDLIWVHDYHLLLLPSYILRKLRTARVGLSLHTPFPSSEIFRTIPVRDELLRGMLNADLIGFHIFEYARHFLTCCKRMLGLEYDFYPGGFLSVRDHKREVLVQASSASPHAVARAEPRARVGLPARAGPPRSSRTRLTCHVARPAGVPYGH